MICLKSIGLISLLMVISPRAQAEPEASCLACDREMRKTFESIQAWRRSHNGYYPGRLVDLKTSGLLPYDGGICPEVLHEHGGGDAAHRENTSRGQDADPPGTYEYEMSDRVLRASIDRMYLPTGAPDYTRQQIKSILLQRPFFEQVPILRCSSHRAAAPPLFAGKDDVRRNATVAGTIYWSGTYWEQLWLDDVPYCAREANVLFGLQGPPFHTERAPTLPTALDLRKWSCAFGDCAWWWTFPIFDENINRQKAAHLGPFFQEQHGRVMELNGTNWWLDGLVQLQGRVRHEGESVYSAPGMIAFTWKKTGVEVNRNFKSAVWLQGTLWTAAPGETVGWLIWHYSDGKIERVPMVYGRNTARFWGTSEQIEREKSFVEPVWLRHETKEAVGKERWLRVYQQEWANPRPEVTVTSLDFVSNSECRAAPFLIAVNIVP